MGTLPVEMMISTLLPTATCWPGAGLVVITRPPGTVVLLAMVVDGAPTSPTCLRMSRAAASVRPGNAFRDLDGAGPGRNIKRHFRIQIEE